VANAPSDDVELEHLLTQLLRMVSPALTAGDGGARTGREPQAAPPAHDQNVPDVGTHNGLPSDSSLSASEPLPAVSASEARALIELVSARGIAQGELATVLGLDKSTVSRLAAGLERKGWLRRGRDEANQRYVRLYLTPEGRDVASRLWRAWQSRQARILAALSADERAGLSTGLGGLVRGLAAEGLLSEPPADGI
jgi:DNA-binding MarR family transcriptional regulator